MFFYERGEGERRKLTAFTRSVSVNLFAHVDQPRHFRLKEPQLQTTQAHRGAIARFCSLFYVEEMLAKIFVVGAAGDLDAGETGS